MNGCCPRTKEQAYQTFLKKSIKEKGRHSLTIIIVLLFAKTNEIVVVKKWIVSSIFALKDTLI